ncbi:uncharacterized protein LOC144453786 [Glandiceps talaboti]
MALNAKDARRPTPNLPVTVAYGRFDFNFAGIKVDELVRKYPNQAERVGDIVKETQQEAERLIRYGAYNGQRAAFCSALWMYRVTRELGPDMAKVFGDAYELTPTGSLGERLMNLYNNWVGRTLACDVTNADKSDIDVIMHVLQDGVLQTWPDSSYSPIPIDNTKVGPRHYHGFL